MSSISIQISRNRKIELASFQRVAKTCADLGEQGFVYQRCTFPKDDEGNVFCEIHYEKKQDLIVNTEKFPTERNLSWICTCKTCEDMRDALATHNDEEKIGTGGQYCRCNECQEMRIAIYAHEAELNVESPASPESASHPEEPQSQVDEAPAQTPPQ